MKTTRQYPDICKTCNGKGQLVDCISTTNPYRTCPVCNGTKTIIITEICEDSELSSNQKFNERKYFVQNR